jgi:hypothetical protein
MCSEKKPLSVWLSCEYRAIGVGAEKLLQAIEDKLECNRSVELEKVVANLCVNHKTKHDRRGGCYDQDYQLISRNKLTKAVDELERVDLLERYRGVKRVKVGGFFATPLLQEWIDLYKPVFKRTPRTIIFKKKEITEGTDINGNLYHEPKSTEITPKRTKEIKKYGGWLNEINTFTESQCLELPEAVVEKYNRNRKKEDKELRTNYYPIFRLIFSKYSLYGGRVYAEHGSYQIIPRELRKLLLINGEPVVEPDFSANHIHLIYALGEVRYADLYNDGDPYYLEINGKQVDRKICKLIVLVALNSESKEATLAAYKKKVKDCTAPPCENLSEIYDCFMEKHKAVSKWFGSSKKNGLKLHKIEGAIMVRAMYLLMKKGIPSAPVHDSLIVPENNEREAIEALIKAYHYTLKAKRLKGYDEPKIEGENLIYDPEGNGIDEPVSINQNQPNIVTVDHSQNSRKMSVFNDFSEVKNSKKTAKTGEVLKTPETAYRKQREEKYRRRIRHRNTLKQGAIYSTEYPLCLPSTSLPLSISISFLRYLSV